MKHKILNDEDELHSIKLNRVQLFLIITKLNSHESPLRSPTQLPVFELLRAFRNSIYEVVANGISLMTDEEK